jgi:hypothetical protein
MIDSFLRTWQFISNHPLASRKRSIAIAQWFKWQIGSRSLKMPVIFPWIGESKLVVEQGMTGATGNIYTGLHEFVDMNHLSSNYLWIKNPTAVLECCKLANQYQALGINF